jgi:hypothetical protein
MEPGPVVVPQLSLQDTMDRISGLGACTCSIDPYGCPQGMALAKAIIERALRGES